MTVVNRRECLRWIGIVSAAAMAGRLLRDRTARAGVSTRPRFYLQLIPQGGIDPVYCVDPKKASEVEPGVDVPFAESEIVEAHGARLGPSFKLLARWMPRLAIVNGFRQNSANHVGGLAHVTRFKSHASEATPTLLELLGARREHEATGAVAVGFALASGYSPQFLGMPSRVFFGDRPGLFDHLAQADPDDLVEAGKALRREAGRLSGARASHAERITAENLTAAAALFDRMAAAPKFAPKDWKHPFEGAYHSGLEIQRALWMFEHGMTRCATVCITHISYDTHFWNTTQQPPKLEYLAFLLDKLFDELEHHMVDGRPLAQQTVVIVGSEIGRFPRLNPSHGKDHFPQVSHLFYGPGLATGAVYGETDRMMTAKPVSLATGRPETGGHVLRVDDIGTTLLALDGADPELHGYTGEHLGFLTG